MYTQLYSDKSFNILQNVTKKKKEKRRKINIQLNKGKEIKNNKYKPERMNEKHRTKHSVFIICSFCCKNFFSTVANKFIILSGPIGPIEINNKLIKKENKYKQKHF